MKFCKDCENMLYIRLLSEDSNKLIYYCRNCGNTYDNIDKDNVCVLNSNVNMHDKGYLQDINEYTKLDPTLPRIKTIKCPNQACLSNSDKAEKVENEVLYIRYDDTNIKYIYMCAHCNTTWKTGNQS